MRRHQLRYLVELDEAEGRQLSRRNPNALSRSVFEDPAVKYEDQKLRFALQCSPEVCAQQAQTRDLEPQLLANFSDAPFQR